MASQVLSAEEMISKYSFGILLFGPASIICGQPSRINLRRVWGTIQTWFGVRYDAFAMYTLALALCGRHLEFSLLLCVEVVIIVLLPLSVSCSGTALHGYTR
jgi:hypothetical protein